MVLASNHFGFDPEVESKDNIDPGCKPLVVPWNQEGPQTFGHSRHVRVISSDTNLWLTINVFLFEHDGYLIFSGSALIFVLKLVKVPDNLFTFILFRTCG